MIPGRTKPPALAELLSTTGIRSEIHGGDLYLFLDSPDARRLAPKLFPPPSWRGREPDGTRLWIYRRDDLEAS